MKRYIENLRTSSEEENLRCEEVKAKSQHADKRVLCDKPLTEQLVELFSNFTPAMLSRPISTSELLPRLSGRFNMRPHAMHVGQALRALGWTSKRDWTRCGGGRRYWLPPSMTL